MIVPIDWVGMWRSRENIGASAPTIEKTIPDNNETRPQRFTSSRSDEPDEFTLLPFLYAYVRCFARQAGPSVAAGLVGPFPVAGRRSADDVQVLADVIDRPVEIIPPVIDDQRTLHSL